MTIDEMREAVRLPEDASDAEVVAAYAALIEDGLPASIELDEPVTVEQVRLHCKIEVDNEDLLILQKIRAAREWVEDRTSRIVARRTFAAYFRHWGACLQIFNRPVISIDAIAYSGAAGPAIFDGATFARGVNPTKICPGAAVWPALRPEGGVTVIYTAGYGQDDVPRCMIEAIIVLVAGMMSEREGAYDTSIKAAERLLERLTLALV